jgi:glycosyltransferase involved in cell wall biosynthesis
MRKSERVSDEADMTSAGPAAPVLSVVIPAYNEARNMRRTLDQAWSYLASRPYSTELLVVDDGSEDSTAEIVREFAKARSGVQLLSIQHGGKAVALRTGMLAASGDLIAFSDADLATPLDYIDVFREAVQKGCDVVIGTREGQGAERIGEPSYRHVMGRGFNLIVRILLLPGIHDSQCGFKLFTRDAAQTIIGKTLLYTNPDGVVQGPRVTAFDVELLVAAKRSGYRICGMPVIWTYGKGSKVNPAKDTWTNFRDVLTVKWNDLRGRYNHARPSA